MRRNLAVLGAVLVSALLSSCGGGGGSSVREVLIDYKHDDFVSSFLAYYPKNVVVHPGDTVRFKQTWTGEPHSVTMGRVVDDSFKYEPIIEKYDSEEAARAGGVSEATIDRINQTFGSIPGMTDDSESSIYQPGARPCFITKRSEVPVYSDAEDNTQHGPETKCPTEGRPQPAFTGRQALYNSGYIPWQGSGANTFEVKIASDATPGTYNYFCNYHWTSMSGTVKVVPAAKSIPSAGAVRRQGLAEIRKDARKPLAAVKKAQRTFARTTSAPEAGATTGEVYSVGYVSANEFFPSKLSAKAGKPVTWSFKGLSHTVSFNVPGYFPVFSVSKNGDVHYDKRAQDPVRWKVPEAEHDDEGNTSPRKVDVGEWDGTGGFHSSGLLNEGDTFTITFSKPGTYPYACTIHPQMIGEVVVS